MNTTSFGAALSSLRDAARLSQAELAERAGTHSQSISDLERGRREPSWRLACALADALGVPLDRFRGAPEAVKEKKKKT